MAKIRKPTSPPPKPKNSGRWSGTGDAVSERKPGLHHRAPLLRRKRLRVPPNAGGKWVHRKLHCSLLPGASSASPSPKLGGGREGATALADTIAFGCFVQRRRLKTFYQPRRRSGRLPAPLQPLPPKIHHAETRPLIQGFGYLCAAHSGSHTPAPNHSDAAASTEPTQRYSCIVALCGRDISCSISVEQRASENAREPNPVVNFLRLFPYLFLLIPAALLAQPRVEEDRPLARATRAAQTLIQEQHFSIAIATLTSALDSATAAEDRSDALFLLADAQFRAGRFRAALMTTSQCLFQYPDDPRIAELWYIRGVAAYQEGKPDTAQQSFRNALTRGTTRIAEAQYWVARTNADAGQLDTAEKYAWRSLTAPPHEFSDDALYLQGWINEGRDSAALAAEFYRRLLEKFPESELAQDAQLRLGVLEARRGNYESAYRLLLAFIPRTERQREEQTFYLAEATSALNRHDDALRYYTDFLRQYPESRRVRSARYGSGWSQLQLRRYDDAINSFRQVEQGLDSIAAAASYQIGAIQTLRGDTAAAIATFQAVLYRLPYESFSDNAYYQLGRIHYRRAAYDSARHYFQIVARQFPESELRKEAYYLLGESYASIGDYPNAEYAFARTRRITEQGTLFQRALYREGVMLYKEGRFTSAVDRLRQYVGEHPTGADITNATFWLAEALYQARSYTEAERYYAEVNERWNDSPWGDEALYGLAWARFQQKKFKLSAETFLEYTKAYPQDERAIEATLRLADCYRLMGDRAKAVETYSSIGKVAGKGKRDEEARFRLADVFLQMNEVDRAVDTYRSLIRDYPKSLRRDAYAYNIGVIYHERDRDSLAVMELKNFLITFPESELLPQAHFTLLVRRCLSGRCPSHRPAAGIRTARTAVFHKFFG
ncbi:MAG: outer membrane protein assembly factor BamD [Chlorobi bacterium CHB2]|nr:outer membrane protein assembly factor BamD [Chlorobi bacterium CHB2]